MSSNEFVCSHSATISRVRFQQASVHQRSPCLILLCRVPNLVEPNKVFSPVCTNSSMVSRAVIGTPYLIFCTDMIQHIVEAKKRVPYPTMAPSPLSSSANHSARYYNGAEFGLNVFLRCHVDNDFTMAIVQVHMDRLYHEDDTIVC